MSNSHIAYQCSKNINTRCRVKGIHDENSVAYYYGEGVGGWKGIAKICKWQADHPEEGGWFWFKEICPQCFTEHQ